MSKNKTIKDLSKSFKKTFSSSSKDVTLLVIPHNEFAKNFDQIIRVFEKNESTKFLAFETTLMIIRFFLKNNFRTEAINFLTYAIYIVNLQVKEELKVSFKKKMDFINELILK